MSRLQAKQSPMIVEIDYSYNEAVLDTEILKLSDGEELQVYSLINLMAEKYRSLLQQTVRNRHRRHDVYDLSLLLNKFQDWTYAEQLQLKELIVATSKSKEIVAQADSISDPAIMAMAEKGYQDLAAEIEEPLPPFKDVYREISSFYENLPWESPK